MVMVYYCGTHLLCLCLLVLIVNVYLLSGLLLLPQRPDSFALCPNWSLPPYQQ